MVVVRRRASARNHWTVVAVGHIVWTHAPRQSVEGYYVVRGFRWLLVVVDTAVVVGSLRGHPPAGRSSALPDQRTQPSTMLTSMQ